MNTLVRSLLSGGACLAIVSGTTIEVHDQPFGHAPNDTIALHIETAPHRTDPQQDWIDVTSDRKSWERYAQMIIASLRNNSRFPENDRDTLEYIMEHGEVTFADLGITETELDSLIANNHKRLAHEYLSSLRAGSNAPRVDIFLLQEQLDKAELSLKDIGTNVQELELFICKDAGTCLYV